MGLVGDLLEKAARATPAAVEERTTGWWFRYTDSSTWWAGAALAHGASDNLEERIDAAERFYAGRDALARFQVCADCPPALDETLAARGYGLEAPIALLTASAEAIPPAAAPSLELTTRVQTSITAEWSAVLGATSDPGSDVERDTQLLDRLGPEGCYVTVFADAAPIGIGRAAADGGWTGVFNMATIASARRRGVARSVLAAIAGWAEAHGAPQLYLQVEQSNSAARRLYEAAGFVHLSEYHYRVRPEA